MCLRRQPAADPCIDFIAEMTPGAAADPVGGRELTGFPGGGHGSWSRSGVCRDIRLGQGGGIGRFEQFSALLSAQDCLHGANRVDPCFHFSEVAGRPVKTDILTRHHEFLLG